MPLVPAKCTECGANVTVDDSKDAAVCEFCGTAFITEKAINNYHITNNLNISNATINVTGVGVENLILRAEQFESKGDYEKAIEYYNRALDIDATNKTALSKLEALSNLFFGKTRITREQFEQVRHYMNIGEKLNAIKLIRELSGLGLVEAKDIADNFETINFHSPQTSTPNTGSTTQGGGCYIATSVYGSYDCPQVWTLRRYRDNTLAETWCGRAFIRIYYTISPTLVKCFGHTGWFKKLWKPILDRMVNNLKKSGLESTPYNDREW